MAAMTSREAIFSKYLVQGRRSGPKSGRGGGGGETEAGGRDELGGGGVGVFDKE